jgi:D-2-hydroxyacid dehydrogenase (NADP+)
VGYPHPIPVNSPARTLLIVGLGGIGMETAKRAAGFGMRVMATRRHTDRPKPDFVDSVHPPEALHDLLPQADWVDVPLPLTADTRDLISDREFALMKDGVHITNVGREYVINLEALMRALDSGKVGGAGLDVLGREAQDFSHPIWKYENIIITPHASGHGQAAFDRLGDLVKDNIRRFITDEPLRNVVDLDLEY